MARNFEPNDRLGPLRELRRRLYRSPNGKMLGVFRGIAESMGFNVLVTRVIGFFILLTLTDFFGAHGLMVTVLVAGFFYLLAAMLMQAPRPTGDAYAVTAANPPSTPRTPYAGGYPAPAGRSRLDLKQLDQQLDRLNHRIQRMEGIVTDRQFDWERRLES